MKSMQITVQQAIQQATRAIQAVSDTAHLDAELLVMKATNKTRVQIIAYPNAQLTENEQKELNLLLKRREKGEPMAYILGHQEFWSLDFIVTPDALIPRPETEHLIEWALTNFSKSDKLNVADLGVGSGAIAVTLAVERPHWKIDATDLSDKALTIAKKNAAKHHTVNVHFFQGSWCESLPNTNYDLIITNPPYIDENDEHLKNLKYEPQSALNGGKKGLDAIEIIIGQAKSYLKKGGYLAIEHGYDQKTAIIQLLEQAGYKEICDHDDLAGLPRFVTAKN